MSILHHPSDSSPPKAQKSQGWVEYKREACPICEHRDLCTCAIKEDGARIVSCKRVHDASLPGYIQTRTNKLGDFSLYRVDGPVLPAEVANGNGKHHTPIEPADEGIRHAVYMALSATLGLSPAHRTALIGRGLSDADIAAGQFATLPDCNSHERAELALAVLGVLKPQGCKTSHLLRVPGFWRNPATGIGLVGRAGLLIPVMDRSGAIVGMVLRPNKPAIDSRTGKPIAKYIWLSSASRGGPSAIAAAHVPPGVHGSHEKVRITEGQLKAHIAYSKSGLPTIGLPGVGSWQLALPVLKALGAKTVRLAFDADAATNPHVDRALTSARAGYAKEGYAVEIETWDPRFKGIDDALVAGATIETKSAKKIFIPATMADIRRLRGEGGWIWENWLPRYGVCGLAGFEGTGKTRQWLDFHRRVWKGEKFPHEKELTIPKETPAIWMCADGQHEEIPDILADFGLPDESVVVPTTPDDRFGGCDLDDPEVSGPGGLIEQAIQACNPWCLAIDSLTYATGRDLCSQASMKHFKTMFSRFATTFHILVVLILHMSKDGQVLGRRIKGLTRTLLHLECPDSDHSELLRLWVEKSFSKKPQAIGITMGTPKHETDDDPPAKIVRDANNRRVMTAKAAEDFIVASLTQENDRLYQELLGLWEEKEGSERTFKRAVSTLRNSGRICTDGGAGTRQPMVMHLNNGKPS